MKQVLIVLSAVLLAALLLYTTTSLFDGILVYLQALPAATLHVVFSGAMVLLSVIVLTWAILRKRRAGQMPRDEQ
jgi:hypothetical protein